MTHNQEKKKRVEQALEVFREHPTIAAAALQAIAAQSEHGVFVSGTTTDDSLVGLVFALELEHSKAARLFDLLHELTDGAVPTWAQHQADLSISELSIGSRNPHVGEA